MCGGVTEAEALEASLVFSEVCLNQTGFLSLRPSAPLLLKGACLA